MTLGRKQRLAIALGLRKAPAFAYSKLAYSLAMVFKKWKRLEVLGVPAPALFENLMRDGYPQAMREAAERGAIAPSALRYEGFDGQIREASWEDLTSDPTPSLT